MLTISDHLDWSNRLEHLASLESKLNRYLAFVDSGELIEKYPAAKGLTIEFEVLFFNKPDREAEAILTRAKKAFSELGFVLRTRLFAESYDN